MKQYADQRHHPRQATHIAGTAVGDDGLERIPVIIANLSQGGAMLKVPDSQLLPQQVVLLFGHSVEQCRKVWHEGQLAGVQFAS